MVLGWIFKMKCCRRFQEMWKLYHFSCLRGTQGGQVYRCSTWYRYSEHEEANTFLLWRQLLWCFVLVVMCCSVVWLGSLVLCVGTTLYIQLLCCYVFCFGSLTSWHWLPAFGRSGGIITGLNEEKLMCFIPVLWLLCFKIDLMGTPGPWLQCMVPFHVVLKGYCGRKLGIF